MRIDAIASAEVSRAMDPTVTGSVVVVVSPPLQTMRTCKVSGAERWTTTLSMMD